MLAVNPTEGYACLVTVTLTNENIRMEIEKPGTGYLSPRFDQTMKITRLFFRNIRMSSSEYPDGGDLKTAGRGFFSEFSIDKPPGFSETPLGGWFHKIGVGTVKKEFSEYSPFRNAETQFYPFTWQHDGQSIRSSYESSVLNGYAHRLEKRLSLHGDGFEILTSLSNTGEKELTTSEYNHNFAACNGRSVGPGYRLEFDFPLNTGQFIEYVDPDGIVRFGENVVTFDPGNTVPFFFTNLCPSEGMPAGWTLRCSKEKISIREEGDFTVSKVNLWGWKHVISPELFFQIELKPGESRDWRRRYVFSAGD
ncbi:hypothetical protein L21SP2_3360 [Salinispira pacifica]|uniref:Uncharacterized protein n=1 Tax=Salinispira pacifica TaxID=1307761 RepID=V5WM27_9SPIO|nr:hypothetical protein L21SP2_3360 [Salinispira pacifica]